LEGAGRAGRPLDPDFLDRQTVAGRTLGRFSRLGTGNLNRQHVAPGLIRQRLPSERRVRPGWPIINHERAAEGFDDFQLPPGGMLPRENHFLIVFERNPSASAASSISALLSMSIPFWRSIA
jgi:hypothetical protein